MSELRYYFDESVELAISEQLAAGGLDVVSVHSLDLLGDSDLNHLERATEMERVLCTYDQDFSPAGSGISEPRGDYFRGTPKGIDWRMGTRNQSPPCTPEC